MISRLSDRRIPGRRLLSRRVLRAASALTLALGTGTAAPFLLAGPAAAATSSATAAFSASDQAILYTAAAGQTNKVTVTASPVTGANKIAYVIDDDVPITAGDGCTYPSATDHTKVTCTVVLQESEDPYATLKLALGDGNDALTYVNTTSQTYYFASIDLGAGKDTLTESGKALGNDVDGGAGDDTLTVGADTVVRGGDGNDTIHATGSYTIAQGNAGNDTIESDGADSVVDGGAGADVIHGGAGEQNLSGGDGNDKIYGGTGNDSLYGGPGNDILYGNSGNDTIYGNSGNDALYGGPGTDTLSGGPGTNVVHQD